MLAKFEFARVEMLVKNAIGLAVTEIARKNEFGRLRQ